MIEVHGRPGVREILSPRAIVLTLDLHGCASEVPYQSSMLKQNSIDTRTTNILLKSPHIVAPILPFKAATVSRAHGSGWGVACQAAGRSIVLGYGGVPPPLQRYDVKKTSTSRTYLDAGRPLCCFREGGFRRGTCCFGTGPGDEDLCALCTPFTITATIRGGNGTDFPMAPSSTPCDRRNLSIHMFTKNLAIDADETTFPSLYSTHSSCLLLGRRGALVCLAQLSEQSTYSLEGRITIANLMIGSQVGTPRLFFIVENRTSSSVHD